ncbi:hypothetical protein [Streptomyces sp. NBC_00847]|uniref:hypothetical protein n=1 Tax=Streptomyces sp. NBC_00847 TaxID=2975850 RepID=UPI00225991EA|nr:hypothetical protein [Streptomyces sp. NBC_00847]MCX4882452.1 hypothetical protein [Streptomyces sp. NBC_00847]
MSHAARARSAYDRAVAACGYAGVDRAAAELVPKTPTGRAAGALRLSARSLDALSASAPDAAPDARCARNAAAAAALAAQVAHSVDGSEAALRALRAALTASQAAAVAAGGSAPGRDPSLNSAADDAEELAVAAAREAGWPVVSCSTTRRTDPSASPPVSPP